MPKQINTDLKSSVTEKVGDITTQIIHFVGGEKHTFNNIISTPPLSKDG